MTRENVQRSEPTAKEAQMTRENVQRSEPMVKEARRTRETVQRSEPSLCVQSPLEFCQMGRSAVCLAGHQTSC